MTQELKETKHPVYSFEEGDIVLVTSDHVKFRVHSFMLKAASGFFRQMFEVPRLASEGTEDSIPLTEPSNIISFLLDLVYPFGSALPSLTAWDFIWKLTTAADKYDMPRVMSTIQTIIAKDERLGDESLELYALACRWNWTALECKASRATLDLDLYQLGTFRSLQKMEAVDLGALLHSRWRRVERVSLAFNIDVVYECGVESVWHDIWICTCGVYGEHSPELRENAKALHMIVRSTLHAHPLGTALRSASYWDDFPMSSIWRLKCEICGKLFIDKSKFVLKVRDILDVREQAAEELYD